MTISFVIPVYNAEKFIERCVSSIVNQGVDEDLFEIILVNDGSKDNTEVICHELGKKYKSVQNFTNKNHGPGYSRNFGIKLAKGEYLWCIDADDYLESDVLPRVLTEMKENLDLYVVGHQRVHDRGAIIEKHTVPNKHLSSNELLEQGFFLNSVWCKLIKLSVIREHGIYFKEDVRGPEDFHFSFRLLKVLEKIKTIDIICYNYLENPASLMNSRSEEHMNKLANDSITVGNELREVVTEIPDTRKKNAFDKWLSNYLYGLLYSLYRYDYKVGFVSESLTNLKYNQNYPVQVGTKRLQRMIFTQFANIRPFFLLAIWTKRKLG